MILFVADEGVFVCDYDRDVARLISNSTGAAVQVFSGEIMPGDPYRTPARSMMSIPEMVTKARGFAEYLKLGDS